jgi:spoIIIJ-associated protein
VTDEPGLTELSVEATGETVGEAKWKAMRELERSAPGVDKARVRFQVVSEGERGLLGVGYSPARVVASAVVDPSVGGEQQPPRDESEPSRRVREIVERVVGAIGLVTRVDIREDEDAIVATCTGGELGVLIGRHGQTIDALQYIANAALYRAGAHKPVTVDAAGYRDRRRHVLEGIALRSADRAAVGERVLLEPMTPVERKVVHERLKDVPGITTASEGTEPNRYVVVSPAE